jgi:hypothetical protein
MSIETDGMGAYTLQKDVQTIVDALEPLRPFVLAFTALLVVGLVVFLTSRRKARSH